MDLYLPLQLKDTHESMDNVSSNFSGRMDSHGPIRVQLESKSKWFHGSILCELNSSRMAPRLDWRNFQPRASSDPSPRATAPHPPHAIPSPTIALLIWPLRAPGERTVLGSRGCVWVMDLLGFFPAVMAASEYKKNLLPSRFVATLTSPTCAFSNLLIGL